MSNFKTLMILSVLLLSAMMAIKCMRGGATDCEETGATRKSESWLGNKYTDKEYYCSDIGRYFWKKKFR